MSAAAEQITATARAQRTSSPSRLPPSKVLDALHALNARTGVQLLTTARAGGCAPTLTAVPAQVLAAARGHGQTLHTALGHGRRAARSLAGECGTARGAAGRQPLRTLDGPRRGRG
ncbi:MAG TPA: hypothetical protein VMU94_04015 [Streptosporangiaceae bacterium]|nr:hypothetical protein [Streptosporangiaceae bacterium]